MLQVKKRRQERELERQQREDEMSLMQRSKEAAQFQEWERQEDQFHLEQARLRSRIRIQDGRGVKAVHHSLLFDLSTFYCLEDWPELDSRRIWSSSGLLFTY